MRREEGRRGEEGRSGHKEGRRGGGGTHCCYALCK